MTARGAGGRFARRDPGPEPVPEPEPSRAAAPLRLSIRPVSPPPPPEPEPGAEPEPWPQLPGDPAASAVEPADPATVLRAAVDVIDTAVRATLGDHRGADELERAEVARTAAPVVARWGLGDAAGRVVPDWAGELVSLAAAVWLAWGRAIADAGRAAWDAWRSRDDDEDMEDWPDDPADRSPRAADGQHRGSVGDVAAGGGVGGGARAAAVARATGLPGGAGGPARARPDYGVRVPPPIAGPDGLRSGGR